MSAETFVLIDGHALIYRAYHAFRDLSTSKGQLVNAVYGFTRILLTVIRDLDPKYIAAAFDHPKPTFRHTEYLGYKSNRPEMPADLQPQIEWIKKIVTAFNIPQFELPSYEADDLIGTMATQIQAAKGYEHLKVVIVTGDRDAFQLVNDRCHAWLPGRGKGSEDKEYDPAAVEAKMGVRPDQIIDLKALMGDASDCIPGVPGIGEKTAVKLLQEFGSVDAIYDTIQHEQLDLQSSTHPTLRGAVLRKLAEGQQEAIMSRKLATIDCHSPITLDIEKCLMSEYNKDEVIGLLQELEFESLIRMLPADDFELGVQSALF